MNTNKINAHIAKSTNNIRAISFDLDKYLTGQYDLETRNGMVVNRLTTTDQACSATIKNAVGKLILQNYTHNGFANKDKSPNALDLFMHPKKESI